MTSSKKFVVDFRIFPKSGEKRLPVGIAMRQNLRFEKMVCDFGDESQHKINQLIINHVYRKVGTFSGNVKVFEKKYDKKAKQKISFKISVKKPHKTKFIRVVGLKDEHAIAFQNKKSSLEVVIPKLSTSAIKDITWRFGDGNEKSSYRTRKINYVYKKAGQYTVTVKVTATDGRTDSKSCKIMVLSKNFHLKSRE